MLTLSFLINDLTNPPLTTANTSQVTELVDIFFVSTILTLFIALSLVLTFHINGTTVHKVLGLLLVSIFVVFLWMLQTQFLFIYVVYIMAFISAVLMLFLSVVLMLPISTLTSKNYATDSRHTNIFLVPILFLSTGPSGEYTSLSLLSGFFILSSVFVIILFIIYRSTSKYTQRQYIPPVRIISAFYGLLDSLSDAETVQRVLSYVQLRLKDPIQPQLMQNDPSMTFNRRSAIQTL